MACLPPLMALDSASVRRFSSSANWVSSARLALPSELAWSCSERSSSASLAASIMARFDFSSEFLAAESMESISAWMVWMWVSTALFSCKARELMLDISLTEFLASASSASICRLERSAESSRARDSSTSPLKALAFLSQIPTASLTSWRERASSSKAWIVSLSWPW